jgi:hypothetical protein
MPERDDAAIEAMLARAGLSTTDEVKARLSEAYAHVAAMAERVRKPRGRMAEPVLTMGFAEEDLA